MLEEKERIFQTHPQSVQCGSDKLVDDCELVERASCKCGMCATLESALLPLPCLCCLYYQLVL